MHEHPTLTIFRIELGAVQVEIEGARPFVERMFARVESDLRPLLAPGDVPQHLHAHVRPIWIYGLTPLYSKVYAVAATEVEEVPLARAFRPSRLGRIYFDGVDHLFVMLGGRRKTLWAEFRNLDALTTAGQATAARPTTTVGPIPLGAEAVPNFPSSAAPPATGASGTLVGVLPASANTDGHGGLTGASGTLVRVLPTAEDPGPAEERSPSLPVTQIVAIPAAAARPGDTQPRRQPPSSSGTLVGVLPAVSAPPTPAPPRDGEGGGQSG